MDPNSLVPTLLFYLMLSRITASNYRLSDQHARMHVLEVAHQEMYTVFVQLRITQSLRARIHQAANYIITA